MEKKEIEISKKKLVIMEQPASCILKLEKLHKQNLVDYVKEILKYPAGVNPDLLDILNVPEEIKYKDVSYKLEKGKMIYTMQDLFFAYAENKNVVFIAEKFLKLCNVNVDNYKYKELVEIGAKVFDQVKEIAYLGNIINTFRSF